MFNKKFVLMIIKHWLKKNTSVYMISPKERKKNKTKNIYYRDIFTHHNKKHLAENDLLLYPNENGLQL